MRSDPVQNRKNCLNGNNLIGSKASIKPIASSNGHLPSHKIFNGSPTSFKQPITQSTKPQQLISKLESNKQNGTESSQSRQAPKVVEQASVDEIPLLVAFFTFLSYGVLLLVGYVKEFFSRPDAMEKNREDYVPLFVGFETFYFNYVYRPIQDCFDRPICSVPGEYVTVMERHSDDNNWTLKLTGKKIRSINVGSYNYLGFAQTTGPCHDTAEEATKRWGVSVASTRTELGTLAIHEELEALTAEFLGVDDAITFGMGFATNALNLPLLLGPGCLVLSDECNHASLILGLRLSGATVKVFRHNDCDDLEKRLRRAIIDGHPRTRRPWKMALIVVEGIYSMEGTICNLPRLIQIKKKYKAHLYMDEAHSIGALGPHGRGVVDYYNCDPRDVDILMGTYTKSFAAAGGYIAGSKDLIQHLRINSDAQHYASSIAPPVAQQIITSMSIIMGKDGTDDGIQRIRQLHRNAVYFRRRLQQLGFKAYGHPDSPVIPILTFMVTKISAIVRELTKRGVASVGVGFPATRITGARMRFCLSAAHNKEMLDKVLDDVDELGDLVCCKYEKGKVDPNKVIEW